MTNKIILEKVLNKLFAEHNSNIHTGFKDLDLLLCGLEKGSLITVGGRPCMGKTTLLLTIFENCIKQDKKCLYFSLEMNKELLIKHLISQVSELSQITVKTCKFSDKEKEILKNTVEDLTQYNFQINDRWTTIDEIEENIKTYSPEYVFIDYVQLIKHSGNIQSELNDILIRLKNISKENKCYIFISSQLSRDVEDRTDKRPILSDLRDSGTIEEVSNVVLFIYRESYYNFNDEITDDSLTEIIVAKNQFGYTGTVFLHFDSDIPKFYPRESTFNDDDFLKAENKPKLVVLNRKNFT